MRLGIGFANVGPLGTAEGAEALAAACDATGVESVWTVEHTVVPAGYASAYPYSRDGRMPGPESSPIPDPLVWLTWVAAHSDRVRLATGILILPQRNPVVLAKEVATLDAMSRGRVMLGIGVGWLAEEFAALGVPFSARGQRTDEYVAALRELWTAPEPSFHGDFVDFERALSEPKPTQRPVPIHVGGHSVAAARRAGRLGDGFFPVRAKDLDALLPEMRAAAEAAGRDPDAIEVTTGAWPTAESVSELAAKGVSRLVIPPPAFTPDDLGPALERVVDAIA